MSSRPELDLSAPAPRRVGRYVLFDEIARGGMASVHLARLVGAAGFSRVVAVKRVRASLLGSEGAGAEGLEEHRRALKAEAKITARIRHPNVVQTLDMVVEEGALHVVMEYVHGATVAELAREAQLRCERAPVGVAVAIVADALQGLHAAHDARDARGSPLGIVHRDVSPQNVIVGVDGLARLLDFGIAKAVDRTQVTAPGVIKGKLAYMPREQLGGAPVTRQADVYAMGVVLWELLAGRRLFDDDEPARLALRVVSETIAPPSAHVPGLARALDDVVLRATAADPRRRFETAGEMLGALSAAWPRAEASDVSAWVERLAGDSIELRAERVQRVESVDLETIAAPAEAAPAPRGGRYARAAVVAAVLLCAGVALAVTRARPEPAQTVATSDAPPPALTDLPDPQPVPIALDPPALVAAPPVESAPARARPAKHRAPPACDPPFSIEANGRKHYKPECLR